MHEGLRGKASPRRAAVVMAAALLAALVAGPAGAGTGAGHLHSTADNPGTQTHAGRPIYAGDADQDACAQYRSHSYEAAFPEGKGTVAFGSTTFTSFNVRADWLPPAGSVYYAGPSGTYAPPSPHNPLMPDTTQVCLKSTVGHAYDHVQGTVTGTNAAGQTFTCSADGDSTGTFSRNLSGSGVDKLLYTMTSHTCEAKDAEQDHLPGSPDTAVDITITVKVMTCNSPIAPTVCTSEGRAGTDQTAVTFSGL